MNKTQTIELDEATATALKDRAAERGMTVPDLVAEYLDGDQAPALADTEQIAELDRRWAAVAAGQVTVKHARVVRWLETWDTSGLQAMARLSQATTDKNRVSVLGVSLMNEKIHIEVDEATAVVLEARAAARGMTVSELLADLIEAVETLPPELQAQRNASEGPWSPGVLAEDARRLADFQRTRKAVPWEDVKAWLQSWGTPNELPAPKPRRL